MDVLITLILIIIYNEYVYQIITLYTLNIYYYFCQLFHSKVF